MSSAFAGGGVSSSPMSNFIGMSSSSVWSSPVGVACAAAHSSRSRTSYTQLWLSLAADWALRIWT
eukprot:3684250-Amphidinium_carterae.1